MFRRPPSLLRHAGRPPSTRLFSTTPPICSSLFNLNGLAHSRESQYLSKERGIPRTEYSSNVHLIRSSEVDPFGPDAPGASSAEKARKNTKQRSDPPTAEDTDLTTNSTAEDVERFVQRCTSRANPADARKTIELLAVHYLRAIRENASLQGRHTDISRKLTAQSTAKAGWFAMHPDVDTRRQPSPAEIDKLASPGKIYELRKACTEARAARHHDAYPAGAQCSPVLEVSDHVEYRLSPRAMATFLMLGTAWFVYCQSRIETQVADGVDNALAEMGFAEIAAREPAAAAEPALTVAESAFVPASESHEPMPSQTARKTHRGLFGFLWASPSSGPGA